MGAMLAMLAGCSTLPRSGPYRSDMLAGGRAVPGQVAVVELDQATADSLATIKEPTLQGVFGDYRPAGRQQIGIGDSVQITLWEAAPGGLFSSPAVDRTTPGARSATIPDQVVARDGAITVPFAGRIAVTGRTPPQVEEEINARLADKAINPQALVTVTRNVSNNVTVVGEVGPGARVPLSVRGERLLDVVASAGGIRAPVSDITVALSRGQRTVRIPLQEVLDTPRENIYLRPDDELVLIRDPQSISVMGATGRNNVVPFETMRLTLNEALAKSGGLLDSLADPNAVFVLRFEPAQAMRLLPQVQVPVTPDGLVPVIYHINMREPVALFVAQHFAMRNKDILYVSDAPITDIQKLFGLFNQLVAPAVTGLTINNVNP